MHIRMLEGGMEKNAADSKSYCGQVQDAESTLKLLIDGVNEADESKDNAGEIWQRIIELSNI